MNIDKYSLDLMSDADADYTYESTEGIDRCYEAAFLAHQREIVRVVGDMETNGMTMEDALYQWWVMESEDDNEIIEYSMIDGRWYDDEALQALEDQEQVKTLKKLLHRASFFVFRADDGKELYALIKEALSK